MATDVFGIVGTRQAGVFRVDRVVAEGGFAVVYCARHEGFRANVALKCLKVPDSMTEAQRASFLDRFREEGALLFQLSALTPAVVRPLHVDAITLENGRLVPFLALEWLEGEGLDKVIDRRVSERKPPIDLPALMDLLQPAAHALAIAHRLPTKDGPVVVIHRDMKPENIFVVRGQGEPTVKILDFGIARTKSLATLDAGRVTQSGALDAFTPGYAAPEQWMPKRYGQVGPWTDVFCLALTMVEALTGRPAISGEMAAMMGTTTDPQRRPTPRTEGAKVSDEVEAAFARALAVDPRDRTQSIDAFWGELEAARGLAPSLGQAPPARRASQKIAPAPAPERRVSPAAMTLEAPVDITRARPEGRDAPARPAVAPLGPDAPEVDRISFELAAAPVRPAAEAAPSPKRPKAASMHFELASHTRPEPGTLAAPDTDDAARHRELRAALRAPVQLMALAITLAAADWGYTRFTGELLTVGSIRPSWIAGPLGLFALFLAGWRFMRMM